LMATAKACWPMVWPTVPVTVTGLPAKDCVLLRTWLAATQLLPLALLPAPELFWPLWFAGGWAWFGDWAWLPPV
jgi:hypothetical protein